MFKAMQAKSLGKKHIGAEISFVNRHGHRVTGEILSITPRMSPASGQELTVEVSVADSASTWENPQDDTYLFSAGDRVEVSR